MSKNVDKWSVRPRVRVYLVMCTMCTMACVLTISKIMADGTTPITMYSKVSSHLYLKKQLAYCTTQPTEPSSLFDTVRIVCTAGSMQLSGVRLSVLPSVCRSVCPIAAAEEELWHNAGSAVLSAKWRGWRQTCLLGLCRHKLSILMCTNYNWWKGCVILSITSLILVLWQKHPGSNLCKDKDGFSLIVRSEKKFHYLNC